MIITRFSEATKTENGPENHGREMPDKRLLSRPHFQSVSCAFQHLDPWEALIFFRFVLLFFGKAMFPFGKMLIWSNWERTLYVCPRKKGRVWRHAHWTIGGKTGNFRFYKLEADRELTWAAIDSPINEPIIWIGLEQKLRYNFNSKYLCYSFRICTLELSIFKPSLDFNSHAEIST